MAHIQVQASVRTNRKFIKAGPAPSWLWLCGLGYCQDALTDGFISEEALPFLGVKNAKQLAHHLERAGLWEKVDGGWRVHDYLKHNRSAAEIEDLKARKRNGGKHGGRPRKTSEVIEQETSQVSPQLTSQKTSPEMSRDVAVAVVEDELPMDVCARELVNVMHPSGRCHAGLVEQPLYKALTDGQLAPTPREAWVALKARLESHKQSARWRRGMVPRLDRWLRDGTYLQELPEFTTTELVNDREMGTLASAAAIKRGIA